MSKSNPRTRCARQDGDAEASESNAQGHERWPAVDDNMPPPLVWQMTLELTAVRQQEKHKAQRRSSMQSRAESMVFGLEIDGV
jgi:hypothetical protein